MVDRLPHTAGITVNITVTDSCTLGGVRHTRPPGAATIQKREQGSYKDAGVIGQQHKQRWKSNLEQIIQSFPDQISFGTMANAFKMSFLICPLQR